MIKNDSFIDFVGNLLHKENFSFIGSVDSEGFPQIRAMLRPRKNDGIKTIYFSTNTATNKVQHFQNNEKACVYFCSPISFEGALLVGKMEVLTNPLYKEMLWQKGDELYYPLGVTDPDYCALKFTSIFGRQYSSFRTETFILNN